MNKIIRAVQNANTQKEIHDILDKHYTRKVKGYEVVNARPKLTVDTIDVVAYNMAVRFDTCFFTGISHQPCYDGKPSHYFGTGKWTLSGDNAPTDLNDAKAMATQIIIDKSTKQLES